MIRLVQEFGAQAGRQLSFDKPRVRAGRAPDNDVVFDANIDLDASGRHCEFAFVDGAWYVVDASSRNGTYVNGIRVQRQRLESNDVVECGRGGPRLRVELAPPAPGKVPGSTTAPAGSPSPAPSPFGAAPAAPYVPAPATPPPVATASLPPPAPAQNPFAAGASTPGVPAFGAKSGTVAMPEVALASSGALQPQVVPPTHGAGVPPVAAPSLGQSVAAAMPPDAKVGPRTVALMIDRALVDHQARAGSQRGLKVAVAVLTLIVLASVAAGAWYVTQDRDEHRDSRAPSADPSSVGARIAAENEGNIYLLAMRGADGRVRGFCTGFAVNEVTIATNAHCVRVVTQETARGAQLVVLRNKGNGEMIPAQAVYLDARFQNTTASRGGAGYDVGLVQAQARLPTWVRLAPDAELYALREGDAVFVYGFPGMTMNERSPVATITLGLLNRVTDFFDGVAAPTAAQKLQHSAQTAGGSSGSPIFLPSGSVIGVNAGSLADDERQVVIDPSNGQRREVEVNRGSNFKYGMRADLIRQAMVSVNARVP